jgi:hypothetical protein
MQKIVQNGNIGQGSVKGWGVKKYFSKSKIFAVRNQFKMIWENDSKLIQWCNVHTKFREDGELV